MSGHQMAHTVIADFMSRHGYHGTLAAFEREARQAEWQPLLLESTRSDNGDRTSRASAAPPALPSLESLVEMYASHASAQKQRENAARQRGTVRKGPTDIMLAGPSSLPFEVAETHANLHSGNILSLASVRLPSWTFSTTEARYSTEVRTVVCSTASDKCIVMSDPETGDMVECLEPGTGAAAQDRHNAAVLCVAQSPSQARSRELVSCGMDSKVIVWDLLHRKPVQVLRDHTKFVVRCAFSPQGDYLATCSYDKTIRIYRRKGSSDSQWLRRRLSAAGEAQDDDDDDDDDDEEEEEEEDGIDIPPLIDTCFELAHTVTTRNNPESIVFVRGPLGPSEDDPGTLEASMDGSFPPNSTAATPSEQDQNGAPATWMVSAARRTWLAYTMRSDCFVHYVAMPLDADKDPAPQSTRTTQDDVVDVASQLDKTALGDKGAGSGPGQASAPLAVPPAWTDLCFNTNVNRADHHVSYSLLHLTWHPLGDHIAIQTGDHSIPTSGHAPASSALSRVLLLPLLSSERTTTLWTGVASSGYAANRHAWLPDGSAAWLTSEEGILRLIDTRGKTRATVAAHGAAAETSAARAATAATGAGGAAATADEVRSTASWARGGNTIIKDVVVLDALGSVASCGFDHTVRIVQRAEK